MDDILAEIRKYRDEFARRHNYDLESMVKELAEREKASGREVVSFPPHPPQVVRSQEPAEGPTPSA